jgi:hypothetical protein
VEIGGLRPQVQCRSEKQEATETIPFGIFVHELQNGKSLGRPCRQQLLAF